MDGQGRPLLDQLEPDLIAHLDAGCKGGVGEDERLKSPCVPRTFGIDRIESDISPYVHHGLYRLRVVARHEQWELLSADLTGGHVRSEDGVDRHHDLGALSLLPSCSAPLLLRSWAKSMVGVRALVTSTSTFPLTASPSSRMAFLRMAQGTASTIASA